MNPGGQRKRGTGPLQPANRPAPARGPLGLLRFVAAALEASGPARDRDLDAVRERLDADVAALEDRIRRGPA